MSKDLLIGVDAGTSVIKAVAFDLSGQQIAMASRRNNYHSVPGGGVEQNMPTTWTDTAAVLRELTETIPNCRSRVLALAITAQGDGTWLVDRNNEPVHDAWLWLDARSAGTVRAISSSSAINTIYGRTATGLNVCQMRSHLAWMKQHAPELISRADAALHCKDWLYLKLTGARASDVSEAGFTFCDYRTGAYSPEVLEAMGITDLAHLLPPIVDGTRQSHPLTAEAATSTGLPSGLPVVLGGVDVMCCAIGAGLHDASAKRGITILGSTGMHMRFVPSASDVVPNADLSGYTMPFPGGTFAQMQTNMAATLNIDWALGLAVDMLASAGVERSPSELLVGLDDRILAAPTGKAMYLPFISSAGERGPFCEPDARASLTGLDQTTNWAELLRAIFDGLILASRDCYSAMGNIPDEIHLTGGAAKSKALKKLLASALNAPVKTVAQAEAGAAGAVMMAGVQQGLFSDLTEASRKWVDPLVDAAEMPAPALASTYDTLFETYQTVRKAMPPVWQAHSDARRKLQ